MMLSAGAARTKLEPKVGLAMAGYGSRIGCAAGVHDALAVQALVLSDGRIKLAIAGVDLLGIGIRIADDVCARVAAESDIAADAIIIGATHTHSGPSFNLFATPKPGSQAGPDRDLEWEIDLPRKIAATILEANRKLEPARIRAAGARFTLGANRRLLTPSGEMRLFPNQTGVSDPEVQALGVYRANGGALAFVLNYACHGVMLCEDNLLYSRDYAGFAQDEIERRADGAIAIFLNGATGNIDPRRRGTFEAAREAGTELGRAAFEALEHAPDRGQLAVAARQIPLTLKLKDLSGAIATARAYAEQTALALASHPGGDYRLGRIRTEHEQAQHALRIVEELERTNLRDRRVNPERGELATHLSVARIGEIAIVGLPGEPFVELGLALKANPYFPHTLVIGYCNDLILYIPTREAYAQRGYEVEMARVAPGSGEQMVAAALACMRELKGEHARTGTALPG
jgi:neutral ceramidase